MAYDVFISYSHCNKAVADAICAKLEGNGTRCWYAPRDILPGDNWAEAIIRAIEAVRVMVVVFTEESNNSKQVLNEISNAVNAGVVIVPFKMTDTQPSGGIKYYFTAVHWLDALDRPLENSISDLDELVRRILADPLANSAAAAGQNRQAGPSGPRGGKKRRILFIIAAILILGAAGLLMNHVLNGRNSPGEQPRTASSLPTEGADTSSSETSQNLYTGKTRPVTFEIPAQWQRSLSESSMELHLLPRDNSTAAIFYQCFDLVKARGLPELSRSVFTGGGFSEKDIRDFMKEYIGDADPEYSCAKTRISEHDWYVLQGTRQTGLLTLKEKWAVVIESGYLHLFFFFDSPEDDESVREHERAFQAMLKTVRLPE